MSVDNTKLAFSSDLEIDKVVQTLEGSFTLGAWAGTTVAATHPVSHTQGRKCLPEMIWSLDQSIWYDSGFETLDYIAAVVACGTNTTTIYAYNDNLPSPVTIYYKVYLLWPN